MPVFLLVHKNQIMKTKYKKTFLGSIIAFVLGTSCCWLTSLAVWLGGATILTVLSQFVNKYDTIILSIALLLFLVGLYQLWKHKKGKSSKLLSVGVLSLVSLSLTAQITTTDKTQVLGKWQTHDKRAIIEIFESKNKYYGKIVWLQKPNNENGNPRKDVNNPIKNKRNRALIELTILENFTYQKGEFKGGTIYDPDSGVSYNCKLWLTDNNTLKVRDYCGIFYKTFTWIRVE